MAPVLVVAAMRSELRAFTRAWGRQGASTPAVVTGVLGIGTAAAGSSTARLLEEHRPSLVVVVGVAGGIGPTTSIGSLVVPEVVLDGATGERFVPPSPPPGVEARGTMHTSDALVVEPEAVAALVAAGVVALDMETAAVARACSGAGVPWWVLRGISDHADAEPVDPAVLALTGPQGEPRLGALLRYVGRDPRRIGSLRRLARGLSAATTASAEAAVAALSGGA